MLRYIIDPVRYFLSSPEDMGFLKLILYKGIERDSDKNVNVRKKY